jgi:hypothetical protein
VLIHLDPRLLFLGRPKPRRGCLLSPWQNKVVEQDCLLAFKRK